jgi:plasmid stabilization system protein ParE
MVAHRPSIIWSPEALDDIDRLWDYYAGIAGRSTADKIIRDIVKVATTIDDFPSRVVPATIFEQACAHSALLPRSCFIV